MHLPIELKKLEKNHWSEVARIYREGIETNLATFNQEIPTWESWDDAHLQSSRLVALINDQVIAWAALSPVSSRCVYAGVAEVSIYIDSNYRGQKIGTFLLNQLIVDSEKEGIWTLQSSIFPENVGSIKVHKKNGFREVGYREKIGQLNGIWRNTVLLERRSKIV